MKSVFLSLCVFFLIFSLAASLPTESHYEAYEPEHDYDFEISSPEEYDEFYASGPADLSYAGYGSSVSSEGSDSSKKGALPALSLPLLTVAAPLQTAKTIEMTPELHTQKTIQPIMRSRVIYQPIVQQRLIHQPILKTILIRQPHHKWINTQPIVQPKVIQSTKIVRQFQEQPIIVPKLMTKVQTVNTFESKPRQLDTITNEAQYVQNPVQTEKQRLAPKPALNSNAALMTSLGLSADANMLMQNLQQGEVRMPKLRAALKKLIKAKIAKKFMASGADSEENKEDENMAADESAEDSSQDETQETATN